VQFKQTVTMCRNLNIQTYKSLVTA